jgi:alkylated DNA repair dioxygenase AlkB
MTTVTELQEGVVFIKNALELEEQIQLREDIQQYSQSFKCRPARNANSTFTKIMAVNPKKNRDSLPSAFSVYASRVAQLAHQASEMIPESYDIHYITSFVYPVEGGKLTGHCDRILGWVVLFSLGCTAKFFVKTNQIDQVLDFESGDALIFNGGKQFWIFHGITEIVPDTCPEIFCDDPLLTSNRLSIQFRQTLENQITGKHSPH